jgi:GntR family transcriptional regulator
MKSVKDHIIAGQLSPDEPLPSVRSLACELGINPNTVQKAFSELERQGVIYSATGRGSFVSPDTGALVKNTHEKLLEEFAALARKGSSAGLDKAEAISTIDENWEVSNK